MTFVEPLDLQNLLVNTLAGNWTVFLFIALIFILVMAAKFRMNNYAMIMIIGLFAIVMQPWLPWFYAFIIFCIALMIAFIIAKIIKN